MLPRSQKVPGYKVKELLAAPVFKRERGLVIKSAANNLNRPRFGVVVPKKTAKEAVDRNRLKRQTMAMIEKKMSEYEPGKDYLVLVYETPHFKAD
jgi:ribonuclease P protein component